MSYVTNLTASGCSVRISFRKLKDLDETERQRQDELDVKTLRILRAIVHNEIMNIDPQLREDDPAGYRRRCTSKVQPVQNKLQGFDNVMSRVSECAVVKSGKTLLVVSVTAGGPAPLAPE